MPDLEIMAKAMFDAFHSRFDRIRDWGRHPDGDGTEPGRETFRAMASAVDSLSAADVAPAADPDVVPAVVTPSEEHPG